MDHYVTLGRSGLKVSPFCLGTATFGDESFGSDPTVSQQILGRYTDLGGNFVDTSNLYARGRSEEIIGDYLSRGSTRRGGVVIGSKFSCNHFPGNPNGGGASRSAIIAACEQSLRRLKTDYLDLYWMHWADPFVPLDETLRTLDTLVSSGKVRYVGFSDTPAWRVAEAQVTAMFRGWTPLSAIQLEYSLLERTVEGELIPMAQEMGLGVTPWSPLRSGALSGKYGRNSLEGDTPRRAKNVVATVQKVGFEVIDAVSEVAERRCVPAAHIALAWLCAKPGVTSPILGARTIDQLNQNVGALDLRLTPEEMAALDAVSEPQLNFPARFLRNIVTDSYGGLTINGQAIAETH
ncbi:aldo/keto reductase [Phenylobacterium sp.]|uniref:aldo/keto reductase n=1 Tax=Phenylobacterium sp. TaxID=1871053 RepID=UPI002E32DD6D|nr:aldo/keto reductase [Phenylobacterium sp.]HEX3364641.1 aldo/keto reductase [Phenylobacterium sp.]